MLRTAPENTPILPQFSARGRSPHSNGSPDQEAFGALIDTQTPRERVNPQPHAPERHSPPRHSSAKRNGEGARQRAAQATNSGHTPERASGASAHTKDSEHTAKADNASKASSRSDTANAAPSTADDTAPQPNATDALTDGVAQTAPVAVAAVLPNVVPSQEAEPATTSAPGETIAAVAASIRSESQESLSSPIDGSADLSGMAGPESGSDARGKSSTDGIDAAMAKSDANAKGIATGASTKSSGPGDEAALNSGTGASSASAGQQPNGPAQSSPAQAESDSSVDPSSAPNGHRHANKDIGAEDIKAKTDKAAVMPAHIGPETGAKPATDTLATSQAATFTVHLAAQQGAAASAQVRADAGQPTAPVPLNGLAVELAAHAQGGKSRFEIRLDPPELGRIEVRMDVDKSGRVTSHLYVEKAETLDLLRRDAPQLERAFQDAGLKTSSNGLQFSLRDQPFAGQDGSSQGRPGAHLVVAEEDTIPAEAVSRVYSGMRGASGLDIHI